MHLSQRTFHFFVSLCKFYKRDIKSLFKLPKRVSFFNDLIHFLTLRKPILNLFIFLNFHLSLSLINLKICTNFRINCYN